MTQLPTNPLPTLADEVLTALPALFARFPDGVPLARFVDALGADIASIRRAAKQLNVDARADLMRRLDSREQFLVPLRYRKAAGFRYCANCGETFVLPPESNRRCCSRACGIAWSWTRPGVKDRRVAAIKAERKSPEAQARIAAHNKTRWSRPGEREKLAEQNRREWADPVKRALRAQSIKAVNGSPGMRKFYSDMRKAWWADPVMRKKMHDAALASQSTQEYRLKLSALVRERWRDPVWRKKWEKSSRLNAQKASAANVGRKQSPGHIRKRVDAAKRSRSAKAEAHA